MSDTQPSPQKIPKRESTLNNWHLFLIGMTLLDIGLGMISTALPFIITGTIIVLSVTVVATLDLMMWSKSAKGKDESNRRS